MTDTNVGQAAVELGTSLGVPVTDEAIVKIQRAASLSYHNKGSKSPFWFGHVIGRILGVDTAKGKTCYDFTPLQEANRRSVIILIDNLVRTGLLKEYKVAVSGRPYRSFVCGPDSKRADTTHITTKEQTMAQKAFAKTSSAALAGSSAPARPVPTPAASRRIAELYICLEDTYDRGAKRYKPGFSDETIAKSLDVSPTLVAARREADFGPLVGAVSVGPGLEALGYALATLTGDIGDKARAISTLLADITSLNEKATLLQIDIDKLQGIAKSSRV